MFILNVCFLWHLKPTSFMFVAGMSLPVQTPKLIVKMNFNVFLIWQLVVFLTSMIKAAGPEHS